MERIINRHRSLTLLVAVLFAQVIGLAVQVRRPGDQARLIRVWAMAVISPIEKAVLGTGHGVRNIWSGYIDLRGARKENEALKQQLEQVRLQQVRDREDAAQARRLQSLLSFKEQFISQTLPAQVIGSGGSEQSRVVYLDRGSNDGIRPDMAVVTAGGIVGKVTKVVSGSSAQVLLISDQLSGVGAMLEKSRLQGIVNGSPNGTLILQYVMSDEKVEPGEMVLASGGDRVFPKGMPIGRVKSVTKGAGVFYNIELQPAADLSRLEEVLVITRLDQKPPDVQTAGQPRASDILADRLPTVPPAPKTDDNGNPLPTADAPKKPAVATTKPAATATPTSAGSTQQPQRPAAAIPAGDSPSAAAGTTPKPKKPRPVQSTDAANPVPQSGATTEQPSAGWGLGAIPSPQPANPTPKPPKKIIDEKKQAPPAQDPGAPR